MANLYGKAKKAPSKFDLVRNANPKNWVNTPNTISQPKSSTNPFEEEVKEVTFEIGERVEYRDYGLWRVGTVTDITPEIKVNILPQGNGYTWNEIRKKKI